MTSRIIAVAIDCPAEQEAAEELRAFWCAALGYRETQRWTDAVGTEYVELSGDGPVLVCQPVADPKHGKNRLHLDIEPADGSQEAEVARLAGLGAHALSADPAFPWVVMADPAGNEFCVLPPR